MSGELDFPETDDTNAVEAVQAALERYQVLQTAELRALHEGMSQYAAENSVDRVRVVPRMVAADLLRKLGKVNRRMVDKKLLRRSRAVRRAIDSTPQSELILANIYQTAAQNSTHEGDSTTSIQKQMSRFIEEDGRNDVARVENVVRALQPLESLYLD